MMSRASKKVKELVGGQAVIEGVMMKGKKHYATAVRKPNGTIATTHSALPKRPKWWKWPLIRGVVSMADLLIIGIRSLLWSADQQEEEESEKLSKSAIFWTLAMSIAFVVLFFILLPYALTGLLGVVETTSPLLFNLVDGVIRIMMFIAYIIGISMMKDIRRVFQYHGAEHMTVHCHEAGKPLTIENVRKHTTLHPRCGSSFIVLVLIISTLVFSMMPVIMQLWYPGFGGLSFLLQKALLFTSRIVMIPLIAGVSYEILKLAARHEENRIIAAINAPGLWLQRITTRRPDDLQIAVAIKALQTVLDIEETKQKNI